MDKLSKKEMKRMAELEGKALDSYMENSDYFPPDWLNEEEGKEWQRLFDREYED